VWTKEGQVGARSNVGGLGSQPFSSGLAPTPPGRGLRMQPRSRSPGMAAVVLLTRLDIAAAWPGEQLLGGHLPKKESGRRMQAWIWIPSAQRYRQSSQARWGRTPCTVALSGGRVHPTLLASQVPAEWLNEDEPISVRRCIGPCRSVHVQALKSLQVRNRVRIEVAF
jgi:hypothetical protein